MITALSVFESIVLIIIALVMIKGYLNVFEDYREVCKSGKCVSLSAVGFALLVLLSLTAIYILIEFDLINARFNVDVICLFIIVSILFRMVYAHIKILQDKEFKFSYTMIRTSVEDLIAWGVFGLGFYTFIQSLMLNMNNNWDLPVIRIAVGTLVPVMIIATFAPRDSNDSKDFKFICKLKSTMDKADLGYMLYMLVVSIGVLIWLAIK